MITIATLEVISAEVPVALHMPDHRLDGGTAPEFAFNRTMDSALLSGDEHPQWPRRLVAAIAVVDVDPLDFAPGQRLGLFDHAGQRVAVEWIVGTTKR